ncbi:hypothetical protein IW262DRAFT_1518850 [Armillaria fumosa]|nr:hypothetical protein IW262DRAFT_1518850 [Armillaria fumosa]
MHQRKWELINSKFLKELTQSVHTSTWSVDLQIGSSNIPVYNGIKIPDLNIFDKRDPTEDSHGVPTVSFKVAYSESHTKLLWDLVRLVLGLHGYLWLAYGVNLHYPKTLHYLEVITFMSGGMGTLHGAEAKKFQHGKIMEQDQDDIVISGKCLFLDNKGDDLVLSATQLQRDAQDCINLQHRINVVKAEIQERGECKQKFSDLNMDFESVHSKHWKASMGSMEFCILFSLNLQPNAIQYQSILSVFAFSASTFNIDRQQFRICFKYQGDKSKFV